MFDHRLGPIENDRQDSQSHRSICEAIPRRCFEIEGEACMIAPNDDAKPMLNNKLYHPLVVNNGVLQCKMRWSL